MLERKQIENDDFKIVDMDEAYEITGMRPSELEAIQQTTIEFGSPAAATFIAFRMGNGVDLSLECSAKSTDVHAKSSTVGPVDGYIPVAEYLSRRDPEKDGSYKIREYNYKKDFVLNEQGEVAMPKVQLKLSLGQIVAGLTGNPPKYKLAGSTTELKTSGILNVTPVDANPEINKTINNLVFSINLKDSKGATLPVINAKSPVDKPEWWQDKWGDFNSNKHYPASSQENSSKKAEPLMVYGAYKSAQEVIPVRRDLDALMMATASSKMKPDLPERFHTPINTFPGADNNLKGGIKLIRELIALDRHLLGNNSKLKIDDISPTIINRLGMITPLEAYMTMNLNNKFNKTIPHVANLVQHASENRNPGAPSDINDRMFIVWGDKMIVTKNEKALVNFLLNAKGMLEHNTFHVHPKWNPELWAPVVALQVANGQKSEKDIAPEFKQYMQSAPQLNAKLWQPVVDKLAELGDTKKIPDYVRTASNLATMAHKNLDVSATNEEVHTTLRAR
jgi:hypothetical protein